MAEWIEIIGMGDEAKETLKSPLAMAEWIEMSRSYCSTSVKLSPLAMAEWIEILGSIHIPQGDYTSPLAMAEWIEIVLGFYMYGGMYSLR